MSSYFEKLKDPRWQRRRLEIMERAEFCCEHCGAGNRPLHSHHLAYKKNADPWDYDDSLLICLCDACHNSWHENKSTLDSVLAGLGPNGLARIVGYAITVSAGDLGFAGKGSTGIQGAASGEWVKGLHDALIGMRDNLDDSLAWSVAERLSGGRAQVRKADILAYASDESRRDTAA